MQAFLALIRREYIEHRTAFVLAPAILVGVLLVAAVWSALATHMNWQTTTGEFTPVKFYEIMVLIGTAGWLAYLQLALLFYFANAFAADSRNNSMLFWKSMPQSDLKILSAKIGAALTVFPAAVFLALAATGIIGYLPAFTAGNVIPGFTPPNLGEAVTVWFNTLLIALVFLVISLLWYAPFFLWVGLLGAIFRRWAIPLAVLIPVTIGLFENILLIGREPRGGRFLPFLGDRLDLSFDGFEFDAAWLATKPMEALPVITQMLTETDWVSLIAGLAVAVIFLYAASEYRRRWVLT